MRRWSLRLLAMLVLIGAGYVAYLDFTVRSQFEGKRWALPARVYARPLELFEGMPLERDSFIKELKLLQYRRAAEPTAPGSYRVRGEEVRFVTRSFSFWDGREEALALRARFAGGRLQSLRRTGGATAPDLVRLDPYLIGSIYPAHHEDRILVQLSEVPSLLVQALLAVEDRRFYEHHGVAPRAILRALWANLRAGATVQGGSTLTQQLVKNFFLTHERTLWRKANEAVMALLLEWHYDKEEILEAYLNEVYLGQEGRRAIHGFGLASRFYFGQSLEDLKAHQIALLVAVVKGPSYYGPRRHAGRARERRDLVLDVMAEQGVITAARARSHKSRSLGVTADAPSGVTHHPAFMDLVRRQLRRDYREEDLRSEGLQIFTTLDPVIQRHSEAAVRRGVRRLEAAHGLASGLLQGAVVVTRSEDGEVLAVVGGRDPGFAGFNRALDAVRPIGSLIKPAVYLTALEQSEEFQLGTVLEDAPLRLKDRDGSEWTPANYDRRYHGDVLLHDALVHSYNVPTVRLGLRLGVGDVVDTLRRLGVRRPVTRYPSLFLGAVNLSPIEVTQMYQALAAGGFRTPLRAVREVVDARGEPLQRYPLTVDQTVRPGPVYLLTTVLQDVVREGTGRSLGASLGADLNVAGKTGTTDDLRDSWFAGFTGDRLAVVWLGTDDNRPTRLTGASGAMQVWGDIMRRIDPRSLRLIRPENVQWAWVDRSSGWLADEGCENAVRLPFIKGSVPDDRAPCAAGFGGAVRKAFDWLQGDED